MADNVALVAKINIIIESIMNFDRSIRIKFIESLGLITIKMSRYPKRHPDSILVLDGVKIETIDDQYYRLLINGSIEIKMDELNSQSIYGKKYLTHSGQSTGLIVPGYIIDKRNVAYKESGKELYYTEDGALISKIEHNLAIGHFGNACMFCITDSGATTTIIKEYTIIDKFYFIYSRIIRCSDKYFRSYQNIDTGDKYISFTSPSERYLANDAECIKLSKLRDVRVHGKLIEGIMLYDSYILFSGETEYKGDQCYKLGDNYVMIDSESFEILQARNPNGGKHTKPALA